MATSLPVRFAPQVVEKTAKHACCCPTTCCRPTPCFWFSQVVEKTRQAREELLSFRQQQQRGSDGEDDEDFTVAAASATASAKPTSPAVLRSRKRRQAKQCEKLELAAAENISQLRLACIHPQVRG